MDAILTEKAPTHRLSIGQKDNSYYAQPESYLSPTNRYGLGGNQMSARNISSARAQRTSAHLAPLLMPVDTPKRASNVQPAVNLSTQAHTNTERSEDLPLKAVKQQPKISNSHHLPSVFSNEKPHSIKIK